MRLNSALDVPNAHVVIKFRSELYFDSDEPVQQLYTCREYLWNIRIVNFPLKSHKREGAFVICDAQLRGELISTHTSLADYLWGVNGHSQPQLTPAKIDFLVRD